MLAENQLCHPSLQRYLPGHLPKLQKRNCVGKTNRQAYKNFHTVEVQKKVTQHLTLPNKLAQTLLPSRTVTRAAFLSNDYHNLSENSTQPHLLNEGALSYGKLNKEGTNKECAKNRNDDMATKFLFVTNASGKGHGYNGETFFIGLKHVGGAGQLEYNDPAMLHSHGRAVSRWITRHHFSPERWTSANTQLASVLQKQTQLTDNAYTEEIFCGLDKNTTNDMLPKEDPYTKTENHNTMKLEVQRNTSQGVAKKDEWVATFVPSNITNVPPPKKRFELTDYHSTFSLTQQSENMPMYITENERFSRNKNKQDAAEPTKSHIRKRRYIISKT